MDAVARSALIFALVCALLTGCATQTRNLSESAPDLPERAELSDTPFFPQNQHLCGPAALATGLTAAGFPVDPRQLDAQLYVPAREGSLQAEMVAASRRQGALALPAPTTLAGLLGEIASGTPVIILQNLGLNIAPRWHYAVVVGYDLKRSEVVLRSGIRKREVMTLSTFEHTWARSGYWGLMVIRRDQLPHAVNRSTLEKSLAALEKYAEPSALLGWYQQAIRRWPDSAVFAVGLGNSAYAAGQLDNAERAFRAAAEQHPQNPVVLNNLARILQKRGQLTEALAIANRAVNLGGDWLATTEATRDAILVAISASEARPSTPTVAR